MKFIKCYLALRDYGFGRATAYRIARYGLFQVLGDMENW